MLGYRKLCVLECNNPEKNAVNVTFTNAFNCSNMFFKNDFYVENVSLIIRTILNQQNNFYWFEETFSIPSIFNSWLIIKNSQQEINESRKFMSFDVSIRSYDSFTTICPIWKCRAWIRDTKGQVDLCGMHHSLIFQIWMHSFEFCSHRSSKRRFFSVNRTLTPVWFALRNIETVDEFSGLRLISLSLCWCGNK